MTDVQVGFRATELIPEDTFCMSSMSTELHTPYDCLDRGNK